MSNSGATRYPELQVTPSPAWDRKDIIFFIPVLAAALALRLFNLNYMEFKADEAWNLLLASEFVSGKAFPLVGIPSSLGTYNPALFIYLLALPLYFSPNPVVAAAFVALLNCAAAVVLYIFSRRHFSRMTAMTAACFFAVNPWAVFYGRKIWQQDLLPLFVVGFFYCLFAVICENRRRYLIGCFMCLAALTQLHMSSLYYVILFALVLVWFRPKIGWGYYATGISVALLLYLPYVAFEILNQGYNLRIYIQASHLPWQFRPEALFAPFVLASTLGFMHFVELPLLDLLKIGLIGIGVIYAFVRRAEKRYQLLLLWFFVPLCSLSVNQIDLQLHYFIFLYPLLFLVLGVSVAAILTWSQSRHKIIQYGMVALLVVQVSFEVQACVKFLATIQEQRNLGWMEYGPPFKHRVEEIRELVDRGIVEPKQVQEKLLEGRSPELSYKYDFLATLYITRRIEELP